MNGKIKFFNKMKGFGFIAGDDKQDYYFHMTSLATGLTVTEGDEVAFEGEKGDKGLKAVKITKKA
ncbi:MAG: cold shock domain-containing protein [Nanoarchaeota archaeon]